MRNKQTRLYIKDKEAASSKYWGKNSFQSTTLHLQYDQQTCEWDKTILNTQRLVNYYLPMSLHRKLLDDLLLKFKKISENRQSYRIQVRGKIRCKVFKNIECIYFLLCQLFIAILHLQDKEIPKTEVRKAPRCHAVSGEGEQAIHIRFMQYLSEEYLWANKREKLPRNLTYLKNNIITNKLSVKKRKFFQGNQTHKKVNVIIVCYVT